MILICPDCGATGEGHYPPGPGYFCTKCGSTKIPDAATQAEHERSYWAGYRITLELLDQEKRKRGDQK